MDENMNFGVFETSGGEDFLKMKDGESKEVTFSNVEIVTTPAQDKNGNPVVNTDGKPKMKPQLKFTTETIDGKPEKKTWSTGNRNIVATVKALIEAKTFRNWVYRITKSPPSGNSAYSSYTMIPLKIKN